MRLLLPKEQGSWGILLVPFVTGVAVTGRWNLPALLALVVIVAAFLARPSLELLIAGRSALPPQTERASAAIGFIFFAGLALAALVPLLGVYHRWILLWPALVAGGAFALYLWWHCEPKRTARGGAEQLVATFGLSLTSLAGYAAASGGVDKRGLLVWILQAFFFLGGILYVRYKVRAIPARSRLGSLADRVRFAWPMVAYHLLLVGLLAALALDRRLSWAVPFAFAPALLRGGYGLARLGERFPIRRLGWTEVLHSVVFACLLVLAVR